MANETVTKSKRFYCVSLVPDICKTPIGPSTPPIPYSIIGEFSQATKESPNVKAHSEPVILHTRSVIPTVKGDEPGKAGGIKSGTWGKKVETKTASKTYFANGTATVQEGCEVWMNDRNTVGKIYERGGMAPRSRLEQIAAMAQEALDEAAEDARVALKPAAKNYKELVSDVLHDAADKAMDIGGKTAAGGAAVVGTGAAISTTVIGAPVGGVVAGAGAFGVGVGTGVTTIGLATDTGATMLDHAADYILSGKVPDLKSAVIELGQRALTGIVGNKLPMLKPLLGKGKIGKKSNIPRTPPPRPADKVKGGKIKKNKEKKSDKPSQCCPRNQAPGGKPVASRHPVHFGTGEEVLYQTDFVLEGATPLEWIRCYRSGSESEDWGICGARWGIPFTASIVVTTEGIIYVDESGRPVLLPPLQTGATFTSRKEGLTLTRANETEFVLQWRDGSIDRFVRTPSADSWLPHGYQGVNAMHPGKNPLFAERYTIWRTQDRDGRGITIEYINEAAPGAAILRIKNDEGRLIEAIRDDCANTLVHGVNELVRIGRVEEVRSDGTRFCHVRYEYEIESATAHIHTNENSCLPVRHNLVRQINSLGSVRNYIYRHHLLISYTTYTGFKHTIRWMSLAALRYKWNGNVLSTDNELVDRFPASLENSYRARAISTDTEDGLDGVQIAYPDENTTRVTDANGNVLEYIFDANWLAVEVRRINSNGIPRTLGRRIWDKDGMLLAEIDSAGHSTGYTYDATGNLIKFTDVFGNSTKIEYNRHNEPVAITDPMGAVTKFDYDRNGNVIMKVNALNQITRYSYDDKCQLISLIDAKGLAKQIHYNDAGRVSMYTDCSNYPTSYRYDENGYLAAVIDALDQATTYTHDLLGRMTSVTQPDGTTEHFTYNAEGRLTAYTDAAGHKTQYRYNGHGLPIERIDALGHSMKCRYDALLQLSELTNAQGESCYFSYNSDGQLISEVGFDGKRTNYKYDCNGLLVEKERAGSQVQLLRDVSGRLIAKQTMDGTHRFAYDVLDRLTNAVTPNAQSQFKYDAVGNLIEEHSYYYLSPPRLDLIGPRHPDASFEISHSYDELGNRIQTVLPNGRRIDILRYGSGHWHGTLWQSSNLIDLERDRLHRELTRRFGDRHVSMSGTRKYDVSSRLDNIVLRKGNQLLHERSFVYDLSGTPTDIIDRQRGDSHFNYDPLGQLRKAVQPDLREAFNFDLAGNLIDTAEDRFNNHGYGYDLQGNVTSSTWSISSNDDIKELKLQYDAENRLARTARRIDGIDIECASYAYDALGRRIAKQVWRESTQTATNQNATTFFVWDGNVLTQEIDSFKTTTYLYEPESFVPLARIESPSFGMTSKFHKICDASSENFLFPAEQQSALRVKKIAENQSKLELEQKRSSNSELEINSSFDDVIYYYECDHIGTPIALLDFYGNTMWDARYRSWGQIFRVDIDLTRQSLRFQGQYEDDETGLYYNRHRYYDPRTGRYLTPDPIGLWGGINPYQYVQNPNSWVDPLGLARIKGSCDPCCGRNPSAEASATQGISSANPNNPYTGKDIYENRVLKKGTILYSLTPGAPPGFAVTNHTLIKAGGSLKKYYDLVQVTIDPGKDAAGVPRRLRDKVRAFRVVEDICVARGKALANPQFGKGGGIQYYVSPSDIGKLNPGKIRPI